MNWIKWRRCPHARIRGIYGDEVVFSTPKFRRLQCLDCGRYLDGPVELRTHVPIGGAWFPVEHVEARKRGK